MLSRSRISAACVVALSVFIPARVAFADDDVKAQCAAAYEQSQVYRAASKLKQARETLSACLQAACPAFIQVDCGQWLADVELAMPTVVVAAKDASGQDVVAVRVLVDGEAVAEKLDGKEIAIDPGSHLFRFETAGAAPVEQQILVRNGEKYRSLAVRFATPAVTEPTVAEARAPEATAASSDPGPLRTWAYVAGGVGVAGLAGFAILASVAKGQENDLAKRCAPTCPMSDVDSLQTQYTIANVSLGLGIAALGTGVALFFLSQPKEPEQDHGRRWDVRVTTTHGGAFTSVAGRF